nr:hypothetical protein [Mycobacterium sp. KBS0706]
MPVQSAQVAPPQRHAVAVEELQDLNRDLAAAVHLITELRRGEAGLMGLAQLLQDADDLGRGRAQEEMVMRHLVDPAHPPGALQQPADLRLLDAGLAGDVAHPRRPEPGLAAEPRMDLGPQDLVGLGQMRFVAGQPDPGAVQRHLAGPRHHPQQGGEGRRGQARLRRQAQPLEADAGQVGVVAVEAVQRLQQPLGQPRPVLRGQGQPLFARHDLHQAEPFGQRVHPVGAQRPVAAEGGEVDQLRRHRQQRHQRGLRVVERQCRQLGHPLRAAPLARRRPQVDQPAAADGALGRGVADDIAVTGSCGDRPVQHQLYEGLAARRDRVVAQQHDPRPGLGRGGVEAHREPLPDRPALARQHAQGRIDALGRGVQGGV